MQEFIKTKDGSNTLFSQKYNQHFHDLKTGAIEESFIKHIIPSFTYHENKKSLRILDICFGIGYNTFAAIYYLYKNSLDIKLEIYSPELDLELINSLKDFDFPKEFHEIKHIIKSISTNHKYEDENIKLEIFIGDARKYIQSFENEFFDIIFQDAFSSEVNMELWTKEYFEDIYKICKKDCILTTYSIATPVRLSLHEALFYNYEYIPIKKKSTLCFKQKQEKIGKYIDMELKKQRNTQARAIYDKDFK